MTVASTNTRELDINTLIWRACQMAGVMGMEQSMDSGSAQWLSKASFGRDQLEAIIKSLPNEGIILRDVAIEATTLTSGTQTYALAAGTICVQGNGTYQKVLADGMEYPVRQVDRAEWNAIANKTLGGIPTRMWVERRGTVTVYLHPIPDVTDSVLHLQRERYLADSSDGSKTPDVEVLWQDYLLKELAYRMSVGLPISERSLLRGDAKDAKDAAQSAAKQTISNHIELDHPTAWTGR